MTWWAWGIIGAIAGWTGGTISTLWLVVLDDRDEVESLPPQWVGQ